MNKKLLYSLLGLFIGLLISLSANANYLSDWTNEDLCRWMDAALIPEHISDEIYDRQLVCLNDPEVIKFTSQATYVSEYGTVFPSPKTSTKLKHNSGFTFRINYKITL